MKIDWVTHTIPNPSRAWWQFWKPKRIKFDPNTLFDVLAKEFNLPEQQGPHLSKHHPKP